MRTVEAGVHEQAKRIQGMRHEINAGNHERWMKIENVTSINRSCHQ